MIHPTSRKTILVPLDHGMTAGPILGVEIPSKALRAIIAGGARGVIGHRDVALHGAAHLKASLSWVPHPSGCTTLSQDPEHISLCLSNLADE